MLIVMKNDATEPQVKTVIAEIESMGYRGVPMPGAERTAICILGNKGPVEAARFLALEGVMDAIPVTKSYKLVSRETHPASSCINVGGVKIGNSEPVMIAGPCAVESEEQALAIARLVKEQGVRMFRGGAYKPRTSPYSFQGLGEEGLKILAKVREETGLLIVTEATDTNNLYAVEKYADVIQIGARNMQNYTLLRLAGQVRKPILLKRGMAATIDEWLMAAEYIMSGGNRDVILCERGIRTFSDTTRNTLDLSAIPAIKEVSHLPVIVDPSHAAGRRDYVTPLARGALAVGADGLIVEVHNNPPAAVSDGMQSLYPEQFAELIAEVRRLKPSL